MDSYSWIVLHLLKSEQSCPAQSWFCWASFIYVHKGKEVLCTPRSVLQFTLLSFVPCTRISSYMKRAQDLPNDTTTLKDLVPSSFPHVKRRALRAPWNVCKKIENPWNSNAELGIRSCRCSCLQQTGNLLQWTANIINEETNLERHQERSLRNTGSFRYCLGQTGIKLPAKHAPWLIALKPTQGRTRNFIFLQLFGQLRVA